MTKEEILEYFKDINFMYNEPSRLDSLNRMLDELMEPCEDAISQKIDEFEIKGKTVEIWIVKGKLQIRYLGIIHNISLPPVTPARKKGEWNKIAENTYRCKLCGRTVHKDSMEDMQIDYPYCHCGAEMEGVKE